MARLSRGIQPLTARREAISENRMSYSRCLVCLGPVGKGKKICSPRCRLVKWGGMTLLEAWRAGQADGLRDIIQQLAEVKR